MSKKWRNRMSSKVSKPTIRWCIGGYASEAGYQCLTQSIQQFMKFYGEKFDRVILHNNCSEEQVAFLRALPVRLIDQTQHSDSKAVNPVWKITPPRISTAHEIFIDNDIILHKHYPLIDEFLQNSFCFMTEGLLRRFGKYDDRVPVWYKLNSGFWGLPPNFDLDQLIQIEGGIEASKWFDEQGLIALLLSRSREFRMVPRTDISICDDTFEPGNFGTHFVGLNKGNLKAWRRYEA